MNLQKHNKQKANILIVAGEHSGDIIGGHLAKELQNITPCHLQGVGSTNMQKAGVNLILSSDELAVVGAAEVIKKFSTLKSAMRTLTNLLNHNPPDLLILIDYPGFNLRLAARAKKAGIKVMFYVSPQIWAWHYSRIKKIKRNVDLMAVLYPFEEQIYQKENVPVNFVGHPLIQSIRPSLTKADAYSTFGLNPDHPIIGLLPGSRSHEIEKLLPVMLTSANLIKQKVQQAQFILPLAQNLNPKCLENYDLTGINVVTDHTYNALQLCDAAITTSGTVTLEVAVMGVPQVIIYKVSPITAFIGYLVTNLKQIGLCNIVANQTVALELLQSKVKSTVISNEIIRILADKQYSLSIKEKLSQLKQSLQSDNASQRAANAAVTLLHQS